MRSLQHSLPISINLPPATREEALLRNKRKLMRGRPRRLKEGSAVIKVSIRPDKLRIIDRICGLSDATRPETVRTAVWKFISAHSSELALQQPTVDQSAKTERCMYLKVPFDPETLQAIGHSPEGDIPAYGMCKVLGMTRQQVINLALDEMIKQVRG